MKASKAYSLFKKLNAESIVSISRVGQYLSKGLERCHMHDYGSSAWQKDVIRLDCDGLNYFGTFWENFMSYMIEKNYLISINPKDESMVGKLELSSHAEVLRVVSKARKAQENWFEIGCEQRLKYIRKALESLKLETASLAKSITDEMGKPIKASESEISWTLDEIEKTCLRFADEALAVKTLENESSVTEIHRRPVGVVGVIAPWNFPLSTSIANLIPALLAGNTVVYKASENTALSGEIIIKAMQKELPSNVLFSVVGDGSVGRFLCESDVNMIAFTGSIETGKRIYKTQAEKINPVVLELGGKDPLIVLKDADIQKTAKYAVRNSLSNSGQVCVSVERILVEQDIYEEFVEKVKGIFSKFEYGDPALETTKMGPMVSHRQRDIVLRQIKDAKLKGAKVIGGEVPEGKGCYISPALAYDLTNDMELMYEETFGPVVAISKVESSEKAIEVANSLEYGLGATLFSEDLEQAKKLALKIESGMVGINGRDEVAGSPFLGNKKSGIGFAEGIEGIQNFTQIRTLSYNK